MRLALLFAVAATIHTATSSIVCIFDIGMFVAPLLSIRYSYSPESHAQVVI
jgi:hypothetical protein